MYKITLSSQEPNEQDRTIVTPEQLVAILTGQPGVAPFNKKQARWPIGSLNTVVNNTMNSLFKTMTDKNDF